MRVSHLAVFLITNLVGEVPAQSMSTGQADTMRVASLIEELPDPLDMGLRTEHRKDPFFEYVRTARKLLGETNATLRGGVKLFLAKHEHSASTDFNKGHGYDGNSATKVFLLGRFLIDVPEEKRIPIGKCPFVGPGLDLGSSVPLSWPVTPGFLAVTCAGVFRTAAPYCPNEDFEHLIETYQRRSVDQFDAVLKVR